MSNLERVRAWSGWRELILISLLYGVVIVIITWPTARRLATFMPGSSSDTLLHYWNGWWAGTALSAGQSPFYTDLLFYPQGVSLVTHNMAWMNIVPWIFLEPLVGGIVAYNLVLLASLLFCGWACYLLARRLTHNRLASFLAGLIYLAWPFRISQIDHPNLLAPFWMPVFILGLVNILEYGRWRDVLLAGVALALVGYTRWQILIPAAAIALTYTVSRWSAWWPRTHGFRILGRLLAAAGLGFLLLLPPLILLAVDQIGKPTAVSVSNETDEFIMQTDLLAYVTPPGLNRLFSNWSQAAYDRYYPERMLDRRFPAYIGLVAFLLAGIGLLARWRESRPWLFVALVLIGLAAGPVLRINGDLYGGAPTLYQVLMGLEVVRLIRVPDRFNVFLALPMALLAAYGLTAVLAGWPGTEPRARRPAILLTGVLAVLLVAEYQMIPLKGHDISFDRRFMAQIAAEPGEFAILNLPIWRGKEYMFEQTLHTRPILQGNASRLPGDVFANLDRNPWLRFFREQFIIPPPVGDAGTQLNRLAGEGVRYLIIHKTLLGASRLAHWQRYLLSQPRYEDERIAVYSTAPELGRDLISLAEPVEGLHLTAVFQPTTCLNPGQVLGLGAAWLNEMKLENRYEVAVNLLARDSIQAETGPFPLTDLGPSELWPAGSSGQGYYPLQLDDALESGQYEIGLQLIRIPENVPAGDVIPVGMLDVQDRPCRNPLSQTGGQTVEATFADEFVLRDFEAEQAENQLRVTFNWLALQRPSRDYKMFVHLIDPASGLPVAQTDTMPLDWMYPTSLWWSGQVVTDPIVIDLEGVPPGTYSVSVGIYAAENGERLPVTGIDGAEIPDRSLPLSYEVLIDGE